MKYRKRPIVIDAVQWFTNGDHPADCVGELVEDLVSGEMFKKIEGAVVRFFRHPDYPSTQKHELCDHIWHIHGWIDTLEGGRTVCPGDWIITGIQGEYYPCKANIFADTYEPVDEEAKIASGVMEVGNGR